MHIKVHQGPSGSTLHARSTGARSKRSMHAGNRGFGRGWSTTQLLALLLGLGLVEPSERLLALAAARKQRVHHLGRRGAHPLGAHVEQLTVGLRNGRETAKVGAGSELGMGWG